MKKRTVRTRNKAGSAPTMEESTGPIMISQCNFVGVHVDRAAAEILAGAVTRIAEANLEAARAIHALCSAQRDDAPPFIAIEQASTPTVKTERGGNVYPKQ